MKKYEFPDISALPVIEELPDVLGGASTDEEWNVRREYIKAMLSHYMLGHRPENDAPATGEVLSSAPVYGGAGIREEVRIHIGGGESFDSHGYRKCPSIPLRRPIGVHQTFPIPEPRPIPTLLPSHIPSQFVP